MLVSHRYHFIYTKTIKTASTSVESYFERYCMPEGEWQQDIHRNEYDTAAGIIGQRGGQMRPEIRWWNHMPARLIRDQLGDAIWSQYTKFCVIRHPFEKIISLFYFRRTNGWITVDQGASDAVQFQNWLISSPEHIFDRDMFMIDGQLCMDFFIRYESLEHDLQELSKRLGLPAGAVLPRYKSHQRPATGLAETLHTEATKKRVRELYAFEFQTFGYV
ncbi:MAG: sulfotransferase family 2 domain-containing protein [Pseudomonadota bacterium]